MHTKLLVVLWLNFGQQVWCFWWTIPYFSGKMVVFHSFVWGYVPAYRRNFSV